MSVEIQDRTPGFYRRNMVLMVILSIGVVGTAVFLSVEAENPAEQARLHRQRLMIRLGGSDPDVVRETVETIRQMGLAAKGMLEEAVASRDKILARRADQLLAELTGGEPIPPMVVEVPRENQTEEPGEAAEAVRFYLQPVEARIAPGALPRFYVTLINESAADLKLAYELLNGSLSYNRFARFEIEGPGGDKKIVVTEHWIKLVKQSESELKFVVIQGGGSRELYGGEGEGVTAIEALSETGSYKIRFVYDAAEESSYRKAIAGSKIPASPLPLKEFVSNEVEIVISAAN